MPLADGRRLRDFTTLHVFYFTISSMTDSFRYKPVVELVVGGVRTDPAV